MGCWHQLNAGNEIRLVLSHGTQLCEVFKEVEGNIYLVLARSESGI